MALPPLAGMEMLEIFTSDAVLSLTAPPGRVGTFRNVVLAGTTSVKTAPVTGRLPVLVIITV